MNFLRIIGIVFIILIGILSCFTITKYAGSSYLYILFTISSTLLLYVGFRKNAIFFDTFIGVFLWLGFWLKSTVRIAFFDSKFSEGLAGMTISSENFDKTLLISSLAFFTLIFASYIREKFIFNYPQEEKSEQSGLFLFYKNFRIIIILLYILLFIFIALSNFYLGIYQRGEITQTVLPYGLNNIYKWLLLFGLSSFAALIVKYEFQLQKKVTYFVPILILIESFITNASLLSRGMILNSSALGLGILKNIKINKFNFNIKYLVVLISTFIFLFISSVIVVNSLRIYKTNNQKNIKTFRKADLNTSLHRTKILFLDRWVGMEGMLAVSSSTNQGWTLFQEALKEKYDENKTSFYDLNLINSPYKNTDMKKHHYISLPGYIAFFYYSGSVFFLCGVLFLLSLIGSFIEFLAYKFGGKNIIFSALIAQVIAYRLTHFGYVPTQSYLLFGTILLNILIFYSANKILTYIYRKELDNATI